MKKVILYILITTLLTIAMIVFYNRNNPRHKARAYVNGWDSMGMYLPADQVPFFAENFSDVKDILAKALINSETDIRQRAAYVVEGLEHQAKPLEINIVDALKVESDTTVCLYYYNALRSIGADNPESVYYLRKRFLELSQQEENDSPQAFYKASDERISIAAALFIIFIIDNDLQQRSKYLDEVTQWLKPPAESLSISELKAYWDHRWLAVIAVKDMTGAEEAISLLEEMLTEKPTKPWVSSHVPRALKALRDANLSETEP